MSNETKHLHSMLKKENSFNAIEILFKHRTDRESDTIISVMSLSIRLCY